MKENILFLVLLLIIPINSALCEESQVDINTASAEELDLLYGIGPVKADAIIEARPFDSVNSLVDVKGIGEITLNKIKEQGLACVENVDESLEELKEKKEEKEIINNKLDISGESEVNNYNELIEKSNINKQTDSYALESKTPKIIILTSANTKDIKTENYTENLGKSNYGFYGLLLFSVLLGILFIFRLKNKNKTEFQ